MAKAKERLCSLTGRLKLLTGGTWELNALAVTTGVVAATIDHYAEIASRYAIEAAKSSSDESYECHVMWRHRVDGLVLLGQALLALAEEIKARGIESDQPS